MPAGTNEIQVVNGTLRVVCIVCGTISKAPASGTLRGSGLDLCRYGCYEIESGIFWDALRQQYSIPGAALDRIMEAHRLAAICYWSWPEGRHAALAGLPCLNP